MLSMIIKILRIYVFYKWDDDMDQYDSKYINVTTKLCYTKEDCHCGWWEKSFSIQKWESN